MNLVAAIFLTLTLVVLPANPAYGIGGAHAEARAGHALSALPVAGPGTGRPPAGDVRAGSTSVAGPDAPPSPGYVVPVGGTPPPAGVMRGFDPPDSPWGSGHRGVDLAAPAGAEVFSPGPGRVTFAGTVAGRGVVVVTHAAGLRTSLEPVAATVPVGTTVTTEESIGRIEASPGHCAPGSCVHWGVRNGERYVDPLSLLLPERPVIVLLPDR